MLTRLFAGCSGQPDGLMDEMPTVVVQPLHTELAKVPHLYCSSVSLPALQRR